METAAQRTSSPELVHILEPIESFAHYVLCPHPRATEHSNHSDSETSGVGDVPATRPTVRGLQGYELWLCARCPAAPKQAENVGVGSVTPRSVPATLAV